MSYPHSSGSECRGDRRHRDEERSRRHRSSSSGEWRSSQSHHRRQGRDRHRDWRSRDEEEGGDEIESERRKRRRRSRSHQRESPPSRHRRSRSRSPRGRTQDERTSDHRHRPPPHFPRSRSSLVPSASHVARVGDPQGKDEKGPDRQRPNFQPTGRLAAESNTVAGIVLKYHEPPEARKPAPDPAWRLYVFKGSDLLETIELGSRSCWLFGRERAVADFPLDHLSCSKQHAVVQFRFLVKTNEFGDKDGKVRYVIWRGNPSLIQSDLAFT